MRFEKIGNEIAQYGEFIVILVTCCIIIYLILFTSHYIEMSLQKGGWEKVTTEVKLNLARREETVLEIINIKNKKFQIRNFHKRFWGLAGILYIVGFVFLFIHFIFGLFLVFVVLTISIFTLKFFFAR